MTFSRAKAIEVLDRVVDLGYNAKLTAWNYGNHIDHDSDGNVTRTGYRVDLMVLGADKIDLKALMDLAEEIEVDFGFSGADKTFGFTALSKPAPAAVAPRRTPRSAARDMGGLGR